MSSASRSATLVPSKTEGKVTWHQEYALEPSCHACYLHRRGRKTGTHGVHALSGPGGLRKYVKTTSSEGGEAVPVISTSSEDPPRVVLEGCTGGADAVWHVMVGDGDKAQMAEMGRGNKIRMGHARGGSLRLQPVFLGSASTGRGPAP